MVTNAVSNSMPVAEEQETDVNLPSARFALSG